MSNSLSCRGTANVLALSRVEDEIIEKKCAVYFISIIYRSALDDHPISFRRDVARGRAVFGVGWYYVCTGDEIVDGLFADSCNGRGDEYRIYVW